MVLRVELEKLQSTFVGEVALAAVNGITCQSIGCSNHAWPHIHCNLLAQRNPEETI